MSLNTKTRLALTSVAAVAVVAIGSFAYAQTNTNTENRPLRDTTTYNKNDAATAAAAAEAAKRNTQGTQTATPTSPLPVGTDGMQPNSQPYRNDMPAGVSRPSLSDEAGRSSMSNEQSMPSDPSGTMRNDPSRAGMSNSRDAQLAPRTDRN